VRNLIEQSQLIYFIAASAALTFLPGPDILFVLTQSISQGKIAGIATATGLCTGILVHTSAAAFGISALIYKSALAFEIVKYAGAAYLLYLAWQALRESGELVSSAPIRERNSFALYRRGIFMNVLNPKVALFFLAFCEYRSRPCPYADDIPWNSVPGAGVGNFFSNLGFCRSDRRENSTETGNWEVYQLGKSEYLYCNRGKTCTVS